MSSGKKIRVLIRFRGKLHSVCKVMFTDKDGSLYLIPYSANGRFFYGSRFIPEHTVKDTFDFTEHMETDDYPKLSIHESGQVHVKVKNCVAGPLIIPPLASLRGQHIATVCPDNFEYLPVYRKKLCTHGSEIDHIVPVDEGVTNGRLAIYVNGTVPIFDHHCRLRFTLHRPALANPLYFGIATITQLPIAPETISAGITVISGWNPINSIADQDYLFIRGA